MVGMRRGVRNINSKWMSKMDAANRNGRLIAYLGHRRVLLQQLCHNERPAIHVKALSAVVQGVHCVLAKLIGVDSDVLVFAAENNGAQCLVYLQGLRDGLSALRAQAIVLCMELRSNQNHMQRQGKSHR
jgi:hypothetical protein